MDFLKVISLGPSCETAWQIRQVVEQPEAYVFDWVIASPASVATAIRVDYANIVGPEQLEYKNDEGADHPFILDRATGIEYHHDFRNDPSFMESYPDVESKYQYLKGRMRETLAIGPVLFVHVTQAPGEAELLADAVAARYPELRFKLLSVRINGEGPTMTDDGPMLHAEIPGRGSTWQDREEEWAWAIKSALGNSFGATIPPAKAAQSVAG